MTTEADLPEPDRDHTVVEPMPDPTGASSTIPSDVTPTHPDQTPANPMSEADRGATGALLGRVLRVGVIVSGVLIVAGLIAEGFRGGLSGGESGLDHALTRANHPRTPTEILSGLVRGDADALITAGLLTLLATPIVRVVVAGGDFRRRGDRTFALISLSVLVLLAISFVVEYLV